MTSASPFKPMVIEVIKQGPQGPAIGDWRGAWVAGTYRKRSLVEKDGSTWLAKRTTTGVPGVSADWDLIVSPPDATEAAVDARDVALGALAGAVAARGGAEDARGGAEDARDEALEARDDAFQAIVNPGVYVDTLAELNADLAHADGVMGVVDEDGVYSGIYRKVGASGSGSWVKKSDDTIQGSAARVAAVRADLASTSDPEKGADLVVAMPPDWVPFAAPRTIRNKTSDRWSVRDFGNSSCGKADNPSTADEAEDFRKALNSGERIYVPPGRYPWRSNDPTTEGDASGISAVAVRNVPVDIDFAADAIIQIGSEISSGSRGFLRIEQDDPDEYDVFSILSITDLAMDTSGAPAIGTGLRAVDILGYNRVKMLTPRLLSSPGIPSGVDFGPGGSDTGINITRCSHITVTNPWLVGFADAGLYVNGNAGENRDETDGIGEQFELIGGFFWRCQNAVVVKRDFMSSSIIGGTYKECRNPISAGSTDDGPNDFGRGWTIIGPRIFKTQGRPIYLQGGFGHVIKGAHIWDYGLWISDQSQLTAATIGGVTLSGAKDSIVSGNTMGFKEWTVPGGITSDGPHGVVLNNNAEAVPEEGSTDNLISDNIFKGLYYSIREGGASDRNTGRGNVETNVSAGSLKSGASSSFRTVADDLADTETTGAFSPTLAGSGGNASAYDLRQGRWHKRGKLVTFDVYIDLTATTSLSGSVTVDISGIGHVPASNPSQIPIVLSVNADVTHSSSTYTQFTAVLSGGTSTITLQETGSGALLQLTSARFGANSRVGLSGAFMVT